MKKILSVMLVLTMALMTLMLVGCGEDGTANKTDSQADKSSKSVLVMGTNAAFPPYEFVDDNDNIVGIDAEIAKAVAEKMGMTLEIKDMEFNSLISAVSTGSIDIVMAGLTVNDERKKSVNFSDTYATGIQSIIVKEGSSIKSVDDLENASSIGVQSGTTGDIYCTDDYGQDHVKQYPNGALAVAALVNGQVDCVVIDNEPAKAFVAANEGLKILDTEYAVEDYAAAFSKEDEELLKNFNKALSELKADGTVKKIIDKYISAD